MPSYSSSKCAKRQGCVGFLWVPGGQAESYMLFAGRQLQQYCEVCAVGTQRLQQHPQVLAGGLTHQSADALCVRPFQLSIHAFKLSHICAFTYPCNCAFMHPCNHVLLQWFTSSFFRLFIHSFVHSFIQSINQSFFRSLNQSGHSSVCNSAKLPVCVRVPAIA